VRYVGYREPWTSIDFSRSTGSGRPLIAIQLAASADSRSQLSASVWDNENSLSARHFLTIGEQWRESSYVSLLGAVHLGVALEFRIAAAAAEPSRCGVCLVGFLATRRDAKRPTHETNLPCLEDYSCVISNTVPFISTPDLRTADEASHITHRTCL